MQSSSRGFYPKTIEGSLLFNSGQSGYLKWTPSGAGTSGTTFTLSCWVKLAELDENYIFSAAASGATTEIFYIQTRSSTHDFTLAIIWRDGNTTTRTLKTNRKFKDTSAWYHVVVAVNAGASLDTDKIKVYINGELETDFATDNRSTLSSSSSLAATANVLHYIGGYSGNNSTFADFYLAEYFFIDGTQHEATDFGETKNGVWVPKNITASDFTMGNNGFYLNFEDDTQVEAFNTVLHRGNGQSNKDVEVTGVGFTPDLVWMKSRGSASHRWQDSVRGPDKSIFSNLTNAESDTPTDGFVNKFTSDGFSSQRANTGNVNYNNSGTNYVSWCWDAGANNAVTGHSSVAYKGTGVSGRHIGGLPFQPDLVWVKESSSTSGHIISDSVRGIGLYLSSHSTAADATSTGAITSFDSDGFSTGNSGAVNQNGVSTVAWCWDAGTGDAVSNTNGATTSTVKASTTNGFSIVSYTGTGSTTTIGHGLSSAPDFMIVKKRNGTSNWAVYHSANTAEPATEYLNLNTTTATVDSAGFWNDTAPTSSVFTVATENQVNASAGTYIAYCWHDVAGKQKFGSYTGTSGDTAVTGLGFRPGWLMIKRTDGAGGWAIYDGSRHPLNDGTNPRLQAQATDDQDTVSTVNVNFDSDGFTVTGTSSAINGATNEFVYMAFAGSYSDFIADYNTTGTIDSRVKASDTTGFSVVKYNTIASATQTFGHGLSAAPDWIITKRLDGTSNWAVFHSALGNDKYMFLNSTGAAVTDTTYWNDTAPSSSVVTLGNAFNASSERIAYCWTETAGVSKFGSYTGTGASGNAVTTGFKPGLVIIKKNATASWYMFDNTRDVVNDVTLGLFPDLTAAEVDSSTYAIEFTATGFTINGTNAGINTNTSTYIYAAFADTRDAAFWLDQSSRNNNWQPENMDHGNTILDSPTENFSVMSFDASSGGTLSNGNLSIAMDAGDARYNTIGMGPTGKYYWEIDINSNNFEIGLSDGSDFETRPDPSGATTLFIFGDGTSTVESAPNSTKSFDNHSPDGVTRATYRFALDLDAANPKCDVYLESALIYTFDTFTLDAPYFFFVDRMNSTPTDSHDVNFGQRPYKYGPPS